MRSRSALVASKVKWHGFGSESIMWARLPRYDEQPVCVLQAKCQVPRDILLEMGHLRLIQREVAVVVAKIAGSCVGTC